jgi:D-sedoheptulose 7-phosphate isomerase
MKEMIQLFIDEAIQAAGKLNDHQQQTIASAAEPIIHCFENNGSAYVCGKEGSAADAQHISGELARRFL